MKLVQASLALAFIQSVGAFSPSSTSKFGLSDATLAKPENGRIGSTHLFDLKSLEQFTPDDKQTREYLDNYGEKSRQYFFFFYCASYLIYTRRPDRIVANLLNTGKSGLVRQLSFELTFLFFSSSFIVAWNGFLVNGWTDFDGYSHPAMFDFLPALTLPLQPFSLSISALALLLTFRTNTSYGRWNEARTAWGKIINDSRSIARMGCTWGKSYKNVDGDMVQRLGEAICAFSRSVMNRTLPSQEDEQNFREYTYSRLTDDKYAEVLRNAKHRPTAALAEITNILVDMELNPLHQVEVEKTTTGLCDALGACERIFTSPVPTFYPRHTARFLALWLLALPTGLYDAFGSSWNHVGVIPVTLIVSGFLLGIEELSTQMEEPFSILPMEKMCEGSIRTSVMEQVERSKEGIQAEYKGYDSMTLNAAAGVMSASAGGAPVEEAPEASYAVPQAVAAAPVAAAPVAAAPVAAAAAPSWPASSSNLPYAPPPSANGESGDLNKEWTQFSQGQK